MRFFKGLKIKHKMLISYLALSLAVLMAFSILSLQKSTEVVKQQVGLSMERSFQQAMQFITYKLNSVKDSSSMLSVNRELIRILNKPETLYPLSEQITDYNELQSIIRTVQNNREIYSIQLYVNNNAIYAKEDHHIKSLPKYLHEPHIQKTLATDKVIYCSPAYEHNYLDERMKRRIITCSRTLYSQWFSGKVLGVIAIDVLESSLQQVLEQMNITQSGEVFIMDEAGEVVTRLAGGEGSALSGNQEILTNLSREKHGSGEIAIGGERYFMNQQAFDSVGWKLVALIPMAEIQQTNRSLSTYLIMLGVLLAFIAFLTSYWLANSITRRIRLLILRVRGFEKEEWGEQIPVESMDEVGMLQMHINRMADHMQRLIQEKYKVEVKKKNAELTALQAQINPHFLYNTLDLIHWMALKHRAPEISSVVNSLAKFFKLSLNQGKDIVTIRDELEHVKIYLDIQNKRFSNQIKTNICIDPIILKMATVKLVLQPIVENAILHGIRETQSKEGEIWIKGKRDAQEIVLTVEDNGGGMTKEAVDRILQQKREHSGYGIYNVNEKIKLHFGPEYGLEYGSEPGQGTRVTIRFPAVPYGGSIENYDKEESAL